MRKPFVPEIGARKCVCCVYNPSKPNDDVDVGTGTKVKHDSNCISKSSRTLRSMAKTCNIPNTDSKGYKCAVSYPRIHDISNCTEILIMKNANQWQSMGIIICACSLNPNS